MANSILDDLETFYAKPVKGGADIASSIAADLDTFYKPSPAPVPPEDIMGPVPDTSGLDAAAKMAANTPDPLITVPENIRGINGVGQAAEALAGLVNVPAAGIQGALNPNYSIQDKVATLGRGVASGLPQLGDTAANAMAQMGMPIGQDIMDLIHGQAQAPRPLSDIAGILQGTAPAHLPDNRAPIDMAGAIDQMTRSLASEEVPGLKSAGQMGVQLAAPAMRLAGKGMGVAAAEGAMTMGGYGGAGELAREYGAHEQADIGKIMGAIGGNAAVGGLGGAALGALGREKPPRGEEGIKAQPLDPNVLRLEKKPEPTVHEGEIVDRGTDTPPEYGDIVTDLDKFYNDVHDAEIVDEGLPQIRKRRDPLDEPQPIKNPKTLEKALGLKEPENIIKAEVKGEVVKKPRSFAEQLGVKDEGLIAEQLKLGEESIKSEPVKEPVREKEIQPEPVQPADVPEPALGVEPKPKRTKKVEPDPAAVVPREGPAEELTPGSFEKGQKYKDTTYTSPYANPKWKAEELNTHELTQRIEGYEARPKAHHSTTEARELKALRAERQYRVNRARSPEEFAALGREKLEKMEDGTTYDAGPETIRYGEEANWLKGLNKLEKVNETAKDLAKNERTSSDTIAARLIKENPELGDLSAEEIIENVRSARREIAVEPEGVKDTHVRVPDDMPVSRSHIGFKNGYEYFAGEHPSGTKATDAGRARVSKVSVGATDRGVWRSRISKGVRDGVRQGAEWVGDFRSVRAEHPDLFSKEAGGAAKKRLVRPEERSTDGDSVVSESAAEWLKRFFTEEEGQGHLFGPSPATIKRVGDAIKTLKSLKTDKRAREKLGLKIQAALGNSFDLDIARQHSPELFGELANHMGKGEAMVKDAPFAGSLKERHLFGEAFELVKEGLGNTKILTDAKVPRKAWLSLSKEQQARMVKVRKELTPQQRQFAADTINYMNEGADIYARYKDKNGDKGFQKFLYGAESHWRGTEGSAPWLLKTLNAGMYDAIVAGNWGVHSLHVDEALIHGTTYGGSKSMFLGARELMTNKDVQQFVGSFKGGAGMMKRSRFGHGLTLGEKGIKAVSDRITPISQNKVLGKTVRALEGGWLEGEKLAYLRAMMLDKTAKGMNIKDGAAGLARLLNKNKRDATSLEAYGKIAMGLNDMTGYLPMGFKNRNMLKRRMGAVGDLLQPFMGMRQVQSRFVYKMWAEAIGKAAEGDRMALKDPITMHSLLWLAGGTAAIPKVLQTALLATLGAEAWGEIEKNMNKSRPVPDFIGPTHHLTPDGIPAMYMALDGIQGNIDTLGKVASGKKGVNTKEFWQSMAQIGVPTTVGGSGSLRNALYLAELFANAAEGMKTEYAFESKSAPEALTRGGKVQENFTLKRGEVPISFDYGKALMKFMTPWHNTKSDSELIEKQIHAGQLADELKEGNGSRKKLIEWAESKYGNFGYNYMSRMIPKNVSQKADWGTIFEKYKDKTGRAYSKGLLGTREAKGMDEDERKKVRSKRAIQVREGIMSD